MNEFLGCIHENHTGYFTFSEDDSIEVKSRFDRFENIGEMEMTNSLNMLFIEELKLYRDIGNPIYNFLLAVTMTMDIFSDLLEPELMAKLIDVSNSVQSEMVTKLMRGGHDEGYVECFRPFFSTIFQLSNYIVAVKNMYQNRKRLW